MIYKMGRSKEIYTRYDKNKRSYSMREGLRRYIQGMIRLSSATQGGKKLEEIYEKDKSM